MTEHRTLIRIETGPMREHRQEADLCSDCGADFAAFLLDVPELPALGTRSAEPADFVAAGS